MDKVKLPLFTDVNTELQHSDLLVNPADVHGVICGLLCGGIKLDNKAWLAPFDELLNEGLGIPESLAPILTEVYNGSAAALKDITLGFELLLPDMDQPLDERMEALAEWLQGFLGGFGMVHSSSTQASDDVKELIADFASIAQLDVDAEDDSNEAEEAFYEIVEYVRMGATYCFNELSDGDTNVVPVLH